MTRKHAANVTSTSTTTATTIETSTHNQPPLWAGDPAHDTNPLHHAWGRERFHGTRITRTTKHIKQP